MIRFLINSPLGAQDKFLFVVAFIGSAMLAIMLHEYAHGWVAYKNGDPTAKFMGRLNLNPKSHFDFWGMIMFILVGFGWAKPVPVNSLNFKDRKKGMFLTSIAGVVTNLIIAVISFFIFSFLTLIPLRVFYANAFVEVLLKLLLFFFYISTFINITLAAFNILPIFPLDGYNMIASFMKPTNPYVKFMRNYGMYVLLGLVLISSFMPPQYDIFSIYINWVQNGITKLLGGIWGGLVNIWM